MFKSKCHLGFLACVDEVTLICVVVGNRAVFDDKGNENGAIFVVRYQQNSMKMRCSSQTETIQDVIDIAARQLGLPKDIVFLSDKPKQGCIYLNQ